MMLLKLFLTFAKIGLFTFGGGYGMISLIQQEVIARGWLDAEALYRYIGICESTPGPIAVNMATFIGASQAGLPGNLCATLGVVLPSFIIILLIAAVLKSFRINAAPLDHLIIPLTVLQPGMRLHKRRTQCTHLHRLCMQHRPLK